MIDFLFSYETLRLAWWALLGVLLVGFAVMDGFDMGVGTLLPFVAKSDIERRVAIMPLPWVAVESGWLLAELGRQPWAVEGVLPTFLGASSLTVAQIWTTIVGFTLLYGALAVVEVGLIVRTIRRGPYAHHDQPDYAPADAIRLAPAE